LKSWRVSYNVLKMQRVEENMQAMKTKLERQQERKEEVVEYRNKLLWQLRNMEERKQKAIAVYRNKEI
jgi:hypothetical protein